MSDGIEKRTGPERRAGTDRRVNGERRSGLGWRQVRDGETSTDWQGVERRQYLSDRRAAANRRDDRATGPVQG